MTGCLIKDGEGSLDCRIAGIADAMIGSSVLQHPAATLSQC